MAGSYVTGDDGDNTFPPCALKERGEDVKKKVPRPFFIVTVVTGDASGYIGWT
jgi:hypothetical protein